jgi:hypothetical protein
MYKSLKLISTLVCAALTFQTTGGLCASGVTSSSDSVGPTLHFGFITLGKTLRSTAEHRLGYGLITTGTYPHGARLWRIPGGSLVLDSDPFLPNGDSVIDQVLWINDKHWITDKCSVPSCKLSLTYCGLGLGSSKRALIERFGSRYYEETAYGRPCLLWQRNLTGNIVVCVDASFTQNRVSLLGVYEYDSTK